MIIIECKDICRAKEDLGHQCCYFCEYSSECENESRCKNNPPECKNFNS